MRRDRFVLALVAVLVLGACADASSTADDVPIVCAAGQIDGDLRLHVPDGVVPPQIVSGFESRYGVTVTSSTVGSNDELLAQLEARVDDYDVAIATDYMVEILASDGLLIPLSREAIPNVANLHPRFSQPPFDEDGAYSVGYLWAAAGFGVNINVAGGSVDNTWATFFDADVSSPFAGRISIAGNYRDALAGPLKFLGYSLNTTEQTEIDEAVAVLVDAQGMLGDFTEPGYATELVNGASDLSQGLSRDFYDAFAVADAWDDYRFVIPEEGAPMTMDSMVVPITAAHPCTAQTFMDYVLDPQRGALISNWNLAATPNVAAIQYVDSTLLSDAGLYPSEDVFERLEFITDLGPDESRYVDAFERARE